MSFSDYLGEKKKKARAFNPEPDTIKALKTTNPRERSKKGKVDDFFGKKAKKKAKFSVKKKAKRSNTDKALGRRTRKGGKTKNARKILSDKHGINRALEKDQNKEYYLDHLQIAELMKKFGYDWEQDDGIWSNKETRKAIKPKKKRKRKKVPGTDGRKKISDFGKEDEDIENIPIVPKKDPTSMEPIEINGKEVPEEDLTDFTTIGAGGIEYDITEADLMEYLARFILGLIHNGRSAMHFEESEETEENSDVNDGESVTVIKVDPIISSEKVLDKIESLGYDYYPQLDEWRMDDEFPFIDDAESEEDKKSILARTYLAALGHLEVFDFDENDKPISISKNRALELMGSYGFQWNPQTSTWNKQELQPGEVI